jgi:hypothetical protein
LVGCKTATPTENAVEIVKEDIKQIVVKIDTVKKDYAVLVKEQPVCESSKIDNNLSLVSTEVSNLMLKLDNLPIICESEKRAINEELRKYQVACFSLVMFACLYIFIKK